MKTTDDLARLGTYLVTQGGMSLSDFDEAKHPRDENGRWTDNGGGTDGPPPRDDDGYTRLVAGEKVTERYRDVYDVLREHGQEKGQNFAGHKRADATTQEDGFAIEYHRDWSAKGYRATTIVRHVGPGRDTALERYAEVLRQAGMRPRVGPYRDNPRSPKVIWLEPRKKKASA